MVSHIVTTDDKSQDSQLPKPTSKTADVSVDPAYASDVEDADASNPFRDPKVASFYRELYDKVQYECRHEFNPELEWDQKEERKLVRKLDW